MSCTSEAFSHNWGNVPDVLQPDATLVRDHDARKEGRRAGEEKHWLDDCIGKLRLVWGLPTRWKEKAPGEDAVEAHAGDRGSTPNKRALMRLRAWSMNPRNARYRALLIDFYVKQKTTQGLQFAEGNTSSHGQLWLGWAAIAHALALAYDDHEMLEHTGDWWCQWATLDDELKDPDGHRTSPNPRSAGASNDQMTVVSHMIPGTKAPEMSLIRGAKGQERPLIMPAKKGYPGFWNDPYNVGACVIGVLRHRGDTLGGATEGKRSKVKLRDPMKVSRNDLGESVKEIPFSRASEVLFACAQLRHNPNLPGWRETSPGRYEAPHRGGRFPNGLANPFPVPNIIKLDGNWTTTIIPGVP